MPRAAKKGKETQVLVNVEAWNLLRRYKASVSEVVVFCEGVATDPPKYPHFSTHLSRRSEMVSVHPYVAIEA